MPKSPASKVSKTQQESRNTLGISPSAALHKVNKRDTWCPKNSVEYDPACDPTYPKAITYKDIVKALPEVRELIPKSMLMKSRSCEKFGFQLYYKVETLNRTGSASDRGALYALKTLTPEQADSGVITASMGNFGLAMAYYARKLNIRARIIYPAGTPTFFTNLCKQNKARVIICGNNFAEAKHEAHVLAHDLQCIYINGYDHPSVIAGLGTIGIEIMEDLPEVDVILVPVGGGALLAGIAAATQHLNPTTQIYGVEPTHCCSFYKAMEKDGVFETEPGFSLARTLGVPMVGLNSYHTAKPLIDKTILVEDDWITRAILQFVDTERLVVEPAGATALAAVMATPDILPELRDKVVVCVMSGSNLPVFSHITKYLDRGRTLEGRLIKLSVTVWADVPNDHLHVLSMIANTGCNVLQFHIDHAWITENDLRKYRLQMVIETRNLEHAAHLKRVMLKLFPEQCEFMEDPFNSVPICVCYPKKKPRF